MFSGCRIKKQRCCIACGDRAMFYESVHILDTVPDLLNPGSSWNKIIDTWVTIIREKDPSADFSSKNETTNVNISEYYKIEFMHWK